MTEQTNKTKYIYVIDLNERGYFNAHVENWQGKEVYSLSNCHVIFDDETGDEIGEEYGNLDLVDNGYMKYWQDVKGLLEYLIDMKVIPAGSTLSMLDHHI
jgi:Zn-finger protein